MLGLVLSFALHASPAPAAPAWPANKPKKDAVRAVELAKLFNGTAGVVSTREARFVDLTGDGIEEAIVPLDSQGSAGDTAIAVFGYDELGVLRPLLMHQGQHLMFDVTGGKLAITEPVYGPDDANCCPSATAVITYSWNGHALIPGEKKMGPAPKPASKK